MSELFLRVHDGNFEFGLYDGHIQTGLEPTAVVTVPIVIDVVNPWVSTTAVSESLGGMYTAKGQRHWSTSLYTIRYTSWNLGEDIGSGQTRRQRSILKGQWGSREDEGVTRRG